MTSLDTTLCLFAKEPRPGRVKTRLCPPLSPAQAALLASALLEDMVRMARRASWAQLVLCLDGQRDGLPEVCAPLPVWPQGAGDLGARLEGALTRALKERPLAMAVGSDHPGLPLRLLRAAREQLANGADAVIGPCPDGGYYLIGLRRCSKGLLAELPWSSPRTRVRTLERLRARGFEPVLLEPWSDLDDPEDLLALPAQFSAGLCAPALQAVLKKLDLTRTDQDGDSP